MYRRLVVHDPVLGTRLIPGVQRRVDFETGAYRVQANAYGFRDRDWQVERSPGTRRVLVYGDSFTYGVGVDAADRFTAQLEAALPGVEFFNFGSIGSGTDQQFLTHSHVGSEFEFDLILATPWTENITRNLATSRVWTSPAPDPDSDEDWVAVLDKPYFTLDGERLVLHNEHIDPPELMPYDAHREQSDETTSILDALRWRLRFGFPRVQDLLQRLTRHQPVAGKMHADVDGEPWRLQRAIFEKWAAEAETPLLVCPIPLCQHIEGVASAADVGRRYEELHDPAAGIHTFDALPALSAGSRAARRAYRFPTDVHFTAAGHAAFADAIADEVERVLDEVAPVSS